MDVLRVFIDKAFHSRIQFPLFILKSGGNLFLLDILPKRLVLPLAELQRAVRQHPQTAIANRLVLGLPVSYHEVHRHFIPKRRPVIAGDPAVQNVPLIAIS